jgi:hypothetical protein
MGKESNITIDLKPTPILVDLRGLPEGRAIQFTGQTGQISDGYHTFDDLYDHRCLLFLGLQSQVHLRTEPFSGCWKSKKHADGSEYEGWFIAGLMLAQGQVSYHIPLKYWDLCKAPERELAPEWDGHTSEDVIKRLIEWLT